MNHLVLTNQDNKIIAVIQTNKAYLNIEQKVKWAIKDDTNCEDVEIIKDINFKGDYYTVKVWITDEDQEGYEETYYLTETAVY